MFTFEVGGVERQFAVLAALQEWLDNRLIAPTTPVWVEAEGQLVEAQHVPGLTISTKPLPKVEPRPYDRDYLRKVPSYLFLSIFSMICFCLPIGIVAVVYAAQVDGHLRRGDQWSAIESLDSAKTWALWAIGLGVIGSFFYFLMRVYK